MDYYLDLEAIETSCLHCTLYNYDGIPLLYKMVYNIYQQNMLSQVKKNPNLHRLQEPG